MTDHIPAEAVEAAARAIQSAHVPVTGEAVPGWESESEAWRKTYRDFARAALSAALPFLRPEPSEDERRRGVAAVLVSNGIKPHNPVYYKLIDSLAAGFARRPMPSRDEVRMLVGSELAEADPSDTIPDEVHDRAREAITDAVLALFKGGER